MGTTHHGLARVSENGLLIITFDESSGDSTACCNELPGAGGGIVGAVLLSPGIAPGTVSTTGYNHYSLLASIEDVFGLPRIGDAVSANAFGPDVYTHPSGIASSTSGGNPSGGKSAVGGPKGKSGSNGRAGALSAAQLRLLIRRQIAPSRPRTMIADLIKHRRCWVRFRMPEAGRVLLQWYKVPAGARLAKERRRRARPVLIASGQALFRFGRTRMIQLELTPAGRRLLKRGNRFTLTTKGTVRPRRGRSVSTSRTFVLRA